MSIQDSRCVSMVGDLIRQLDGLNQLRPTSTEEDEEDMAWPGVRSKSPLFSPTFSFRIIIYKVK